MMNASIQLGIIADDFTGATDVAGFLVANGVRTVLLVGVPPNHREPGARIGDDVDARAVVISLKSRSCPPEQAVADSLAALDRLRDHGSRQIYQKYCSTFDSTPEGNIGPVTDALLDEIGSGFTVICPALPENGRTIYNGYLFVNGELLEESGMRHHPVNPMTDSHLVRLMEAQGRGKGGIVTVDTIEEGAAAVRSRFDALRTRDVRYAVLDALRDEHLDVLAEAICDLPLVTGGSGLAAAMARAWDGRVGSDEAAAAGRPADGDTVVLSGSCSEMTRAQVRAYAAQAPSLAVDVERCVEEKSYADELAAWVRRARPSSRWAPLVYATTNPETLAGIRRRLGARAADAVETTFGRLAGRLAAEGTRRFIVAGGETSGSVVQALDVKGFHVGPQIAPGVPWVRAIDTPFSMALKSGNFGDERFFFACQEDEVE